jgi:hypothetical protein
MILITSAAFVESGLRAEFGKLPPCMLPVQNRRLFAHQIKLFTEDEVVITLPESYQITRFDEKQIFSNKIKILKVPEHLSLGESVVYSLNVLGRFNEPIKILHGDTLMAKIPTELDLCTIANVKDNYNWSYYKGLDGNYAYTGYFAFKSQSLLIKSIVEKGSNFIEGIRAYNEVNRLIYKKVNDWMDFGLTNSYYRSKSQMTTQRAFNDLKIDKYSVKKMSKDSNKILAEAHWFRNIPKELKQFTPGLWDYGLMEENKGFYEIEYLYLSSLADLFVFGKNPIFVWKTILNGCRDFINCSAKFLPTDTNEVAIDSLNIFGPKTIKRLSIFCSKQNIDMDHSFIINGTKTPSLNNIVKEITKLMIDPAPKFMRIIHGDFCFSNILYDFKSQSIKVIDPRGINMSNKYSIYGDIRYDVAKLSHSVLGMYDFIIGGNFNYASNNRYNLELTFTNEIEIIEIQAYFKKMIFLGYDLIEMKIYPILIHLFLSMLPLHNDYPERQNAMLANALRLYLEYKEQKK